MEINGPVQCTGHGCLHTNENLIVNLHYIYGQTLACTALYI